MKTLALLSVTLCLLCSVQAARYCKDSTCFDNLEDLAEFDNQLEQNVEDANEVCYADLGCFSTTDGDLAFLGVLPATPAYIGTEFKLYSNTLTNGTTLDYRDPSTYMKYGFLQRRPEWITLIVHGFGSGPGSEWVHRLKDAVLGDIGGYVIIVDWQNGAAYPRYVNAAANMELVGRTTARLVQRLIYSYSPGLSASRIHFIGHSLGAQMGHFFSTYLRKISGLKPGRITALDAAGPRFEISGVFVNRDDADFVEALHTSGGHSYARGQLGMIEPIGHVDFYANGGQHQPGCKTGIIHLHFADYACSHMRSHDLYIESRGKEACRFISYSCAGGMAQYRRGKCVKEPDQWSELGWHSRDRPGRGIQFFETNSRSPFCEDHLTFGRYPALIENSL